MAYHTNPSCPSKLDVCLHEQPNCCSHRIFSVTKTKCLGVRRITSFAVPSCTAKVVGTPKGRSVTVWYCALWYSHLRFGKVNELFFQHPIHSSRHAAANDDCKGPCRNGRGPGAGSEINWDTLYAFVLIKLQSVVRDGNMVVGRRSTIFQILTSEFK